MPAVFLAAEGLPVSLAVLRAHSQIKLHRKEELPIPTSALSWSDSDLTVYLTLMGTLRFPESDTLIMHLMHNGVRKMDLRQLIAWTLVEAAAEGRLRDADTGGSSSRNAPVSSSSGVAGPSGSGQCDSNPSSSDSSEDHRGVTGGVVTRGSASVQRPPTASESLFVTKRSREPYKPTSRTDPGGDKVGPMWMLQPSFGGPVEPGFFPLSADSTRVAARGSADFRGGYQGGTWNIDFDTPDHQCGNKVAFVAASKLRSSASLVDDVALIARVVQDQGGKGLLLKLPKKTAGAMS